MPIFILHHKGPVEWMGGIIATCAGDYEGDLVLLKKLKEFRK